MLDAIVAKIKYFDLAFTSRINLVLSPYYPNTPVPFLSQRISLFVKIGFYTFFVLIPILILKLKHEDNAFVSLLMVVVLSVIGLSIILTFFGFFQLLFTYP